jgi:hypothetical protein
MASRLNFVAEHVIKGKAYPALATWSAHPYTQDWRQFGQHWPYTVPCELHEHCKNHNYPYEIYSIDQSNNPNSFYSIGLGFFNFEIDYFALIPAEIYQKINDRKVTVLFYYHEGDNPHRVKQRLDFLCKQHSLDLDCYKFVSGNTQADQIKNFAWFPDHELLYWQRNKKTPATSIHLNPRPYDFTVLNRTHKWWRATIMADLVEQGILNCSQWSYNTNVLINDNPEDNPLEVNTLNLELKIKKFLSSGPYTCDSLTADQHNDHHLHVPEHYTQSYCHIVLETHYDADQSGGAFLTEKTFKPIKHGQPFVIAGPAGSLAALKALGYRTFDHAIDNSYDLESNNTLRWIKLRNAIEKIKQQNLSDWFASCLDDVCYNQQLFCNSKRNRLNNLHHKLFKHT